MSLPHIPTAVAPADVASAADAPDAMSLTGRWWERAEILLVADRQQGSTHRFFEDWRMEVVTGPDQADPGRCLFASPIPQGMLANSGWRYTLLRLPDRPGFETLDTAAFSWTVNQSGQTPDPFAGAYKQAHSWLTQARN